MPRDILAEYAAYGLMPIGGGDHDDPADPPSDPPSDDPPETPPAFTPPKDQAEFDRMIKDRLDRATKKASEDTEKAIREQIEREAQEAADKEKGEFEKLYNDMKAKYEQSERDRKADQLALLRSKVATRHKLPEKLIERLSGETEEELEKDAAELAKLITTNEDPPDNDTGTRSHRTNRRTPQKPEFQFRSSGKTVKVPGS